MMPIIIGIAVLVVVIIGIVGFVVNRLVIVDPSEALIVSGSRDKDTGIKVVPSGGRVFVIPFIQNYTVVGLSQISLGLTVEGVDKNSIPLVVAATANIKVGSSEEMIRAAAERFSAYKDFDSAIRENVNPILTGALRTIIAQMTTKDLLTNREELSKNVLESAQPVLRTMGLDLDSLTVNDIADKKDYISDLGEKEAAEVKKQARIARAEAEREANEAEVAARIAIAEKKKDFEIRQAILQAETDEEQAKARAASPLEDAAQNTKIAEANKARAIEEAELKAKELQITVRVPADAELYRIEQEAAANKASRIAEAQARAEEIRLEGEAEAASIRAKGEAEAAAMTLKAEAFEKYNQAAMAQMALEKAPAIAQALAAPMGNIGDLTVISADGAGSLADTVVKGFAQIDGVLTGMGSRGLIDLLGLSDKNEESHEVIEVPATLTGDVSN